MTLFIELLGKVKHHNFLNQQQQSLLDSVLSGDLFDFFSPKDKKIEQKVKLVQRLLDLGFTLQSEETLKKIKTWPEGKLKKQILKKFSQ